MYTDYIIPMYDCLIGQTCYDCKVLFKLIIKS